MADFSLNQVEVDMSSIDDFRIEMLRHISQLNSFQDSWSAWQPLIKSQLGSKPSAQSIYDLGEKLEDIFKGNVVTGRDNSAVSTGGTAWECLVCWYLNLVFYGTDVIVVRPHVNFMPATLSKALTISISNVKTNTESDLVAFNVPSLSGGAKYDLRGIDAVISSNPLNTELSVIQCKTNWNDNAQIPMLWDLIYSSNSFRMANVSVGTGGISPTSFKRFTYSFVTVPTSRGQFAANSLAVLRVKNLSGGNYWGRQSKSGVARSLNEYFTSNFGTYFAGTVQQSIDQNVISNPAILNSFLSINF